tara:strand:+ start:1131 stop:1868 length:738 start_codon:yes stop_codon:yes gene_type:complete
LNNFILSKSIFYKYSKKNKFFKKLYFFYNIYLRNRKFLKKGTQFGEDEFIINLFEKNYKGKFLDIGCYHPTKHNNTYLMYKNKWSGINIDLNPLTIELFNFMRPRDININIGISDTNDEKKLYFIDELNTQNTLDENQLNFLKNYHNIQDYEIIEKKIITKTLESILDEHKFYSIDFMNLDIEGHEYKVLKTINFEKIKIKYLCIEMIDHNTVSIENNKRINNLLNQNNFKLIKNFDYNHIYKKI